MKLEVIKYYNDAKNILRERCIDVKKNDITINSLIVNMFDTLKEDGVNVGVGLAAPQVGYNYNLFIISYNGWEEVFINPKIFSYGININMEERCLSFPNLPKTISRKDKVKVTYYDKDWKLRTKKFKGVTARIIQHEYDHLLGKLIIDY
jgi:peptide deformylase